MKKILIASVILVAILAIAATVFVGKMDELIADAIRTEGTATIGTAVDVASVETKLKEGVAIINGLTIANPAGYKKANALKINTFTADVDYEAQVVEKIIINQPTINAEVIDMEKNNFTDLLDGMPEDEVTEASEETEEDDLVLTIKSLQLNNAKVNVSNEKLGEQTFVMRDFTMNNLTGTVDEISDEVITRLTNHISNQVKDYAKKALGALVVAAAKQKAKEEISEKANEILQDKVTDKVKGLKGLKFNLK